MSSRSERLIVDTRAAPSPGSSETFLMEPWQDDFSTVGFGLETPYTPDAITIVPTDVGWPALVTDSDWHQPNESLENDGTTIPSFLTARTITKSWITVSATEEIQTLHEVTAIPTPRNTVSRSSLSFIIIGSVVSFIVVFVAITLCSIHFARKHSRRQKRKTYEEAALDEVLKSGTITSKGQDVGLEQLQVTSKREWGDEELVMRVLEENGSELRELRERAHDERTLLKSIFGRNCENVDWEHDGCA